MTMRSAIVKLFEQEDINFLLTNRIPRRVLTRFMGWFSKIEQPLVRDASIALWRLFSDLDLSEARKTDFKSLHDCFTRELMDGARPIDGRPGIAVSPCDAILGAHGQIAGTELFQIKGFPYRLRDLLGTDELVERHRDGVYATLRLTSSMYHRFHAPCDCRVERVTYIAGDTWNVNPIALRRIERLFCRNERAVIETRLTGGGDAITLVPVAAILVACIRLHCLPAPLNLAYGGPNVMRCAADYRKGEEMGWFEHGSTIVMLAPETWSFVATAGVGGVIRMGEPLFQFTGARARNRAPTGCESAIQSTLIRDALPNADIR
jgi:phosphatidylserine decarboxylase